MRVFSGVAEIIGRTPLVRLRNLPEERGITARVLAKLECVNPGGSIKDRTALSLIEDAEARGLLSPGGTIIEPTSGNTGVALAMLGALRGYKVILTMPETMSVERRRLLTAYGAQLVLTEGAKGMRGAIERAAEIAASMPGSFIPGQFENPENPAVHRRTTGPEIWEDTEGAVDILVAGVGTGGTVTGAGEYLKAQKPTLQVVAVEPYDSPVLSQGRSGPHTIQGIGAGFVPKALNTEVYDEIFPVKGEDAMATGRGLAQREGILAGISSGAAAYAALKVAKRPENHNKCIVVVLPDTGERYLSTPMFDGV